MKWKINVLFIHYKDINFSKKLITIQPVTFKTLLDSKAHRIQLGGDNLHLDQCNSFPEEFNEQLFYHRECRARFNSVQVSVKRKFSVQPTL